MVFRAEEQVLIRLDDLANINIMLFFLIINGNNIRGCADLLSLPPPLPSSSPYPNAGEPS
jgi:hypothetical protein